MGSLVKKQAERFLRENQRHRRWLAIFLCLALVVTSGTFAALRMNGRAMDIEGKVLDCQLKVHQHTKDCFDENGELICGQADYVVHTHSAACYDGEGELVCQIPEREAHVHDDSCYTEEKTLICDQEESEGHHHTQDCYTQQIGEWICTKEAHEHNELCYDAEGNLICGIEPHQHGDACYEWNEVLTCGQEESEGHTHSEDCYKTEKELTCGELELHEHDGPCYDENGVLTCKVPELKEHVHNEECFRDAETDDQLQGEEFESDGKDPGSEVVSGDTADENGEDGGTVSDDTVSGDIVSGDAVSSDTVSADTVSGNTDEAEETDEAREFSYEDDQVEINVRAAKKGIVPEDAELSVKPIVQQDVEALREDESVSENEVAEAEELNAKYKEVQKELEASVAKDKEKEIAGFLAYDISFLVNRENEETGEIEKIEVEPDGNVDVSMKFANAYIPEMPEETTSENKTEKTVSADKKEELVVDVVHMKEVKDNKTGETKLNAEVLDAYVDKTEDAKVSEVKFITESFSTFTIAWYSGSPDSEIAKVTVKCCDTNGVPLELKEDFEYIRLSEGNPFLISEISETGANSKYYAVTTKDNKEYFFKSAVHVQKGQSLAEGKEILQSIVNGYIFYGSNGFGTYDALNDNIYFVYATKKEAELPTVTTLDSKALGVRMYMKDYAYNEGNIHEVLGGGWDVGHGNVVSGLVQNDLPTEGEGAGFPMTRNGQSLSRWFTKSDSDEVNHLFREDKYNSPEGSPERKFYYSSFENYAHLESDGNFKVYDALGTPVNTGGNWLEYLKKERFFLQRGNFFPYNDIKSGLISELKNMYDENGDPLPAGNPAKGKDLYHIQPENGQNINFHFSMYLEAEFMQAKSGMYNGIPMKYEFTGDDDLWVFIDNKLVLDIGGVHHATSGSIDFNTGEVVVKNGSGTKTTYLKDIFKGTDTVIAGETFEDYSTHTLKMFYMERNGNNDFNTTGTELSTSAYSASNLKVSFNLPTIGEDEIRVMKQLSDDAQDAYANKEFEFKVMAQVKDPSSPDANPSYKNEYKELKPDGVIIKAYKNEVTSANEFTDSEYAELQHTGKFKLKPGEIAIFTGIKKNRAYYVEELGIVQDEYGEVLIDGVKSDSINDEGNVSGTTTLGYRSESKKVSERKMVKFTNKCSEKNSNALRITKELVGSTQNIGPFDITVYLEKTSGGLGLYQGDYYLTKSDVYYKYGSDGKPEPITSSDGSNIRQKCDTTSDGIVRIMPGYTVEIAGLIKDTDFDVQEILSGNDLKTYEEPKITLTENTYNEGEVEDSLGKIKLDTDAIVTVTNTVKGVTPTPSPYDWTIVKKGTNDMTDGLAGAEFTLTPDKTNKDQTVYTGKSEGKDGKINWYVRKADDKTDEGSLVPVEGSIPMGSYTLKEIKAPTNYMLSDLEWWINLTPQGIKVEARSSDGEKLSDDKQPRQEEIKSPDGQKTTYKYTFLNTCLYELPSTGGDGIYWYLVSGICLMMASALILYKNRRKEVVRK